MSQNDTTTVIINPKAAADALGTVIELYDLGLIDDVTVGVFVLWDALTDADRDNTRNPIELVEEFREQVKAIQNGTARIELKE